MNKDRLAAIINDCPFHGFLNMTVESADEEQGVVAIRLPYAATLARSRSVPQTLLRASCETGLTT